MSSPDSELKALAHIDNMRRCLEADVAAGHIPYPSAIHSHLNEIHRFLIEFCCPEHCAQIRARLAATLDLKDCALSSPEIGS